MKNAEGHLKKPGIVIRKDLRRQTIIPLLQGLSPGQIPV
jgi:hypothetical protein